MRHRYGSNKSLLSRGQSDWGLRCTFLLRLIRQKVKPNLHSIRERASWCEDAGCSSGEQKPLDIPHHCTEQQSLKSLLSCPLPVWLLMKMLGCFPKLVWRKGLMMRTSEASNKYLLPGWIFMCWWLSATWPLITDKTLHCCDQPASDTLQCSAGTQPQSHWIKFTAWC